MDAHVVIDARRLDELEYTCPVCSMVRNMPYGWQEMERDRMLSRMPFREVIAWDGNLRCRNTHDCWKGNPRGTVMTEKQVSRYASPEHDGAYLVHLVEDGDRERAYCTGETWRLPPDIPAGTVMRQCQRCFRLATRR